jgi:hypothetical protein
MRSIIYWLTSSSIAVLSMRALAETHSSDSMMLASAGLEVPALPENVRAIVLGVGIMAVAYTYRRTWLNFKTNVTRPTGRASCQG